MWNYFVVMRGRNDILVRFLNMVEKELSKLDKQQGKIISK